MSLHARAWPRHDSESSLASRIRSIVTFPIPYGFELDPADPTGKRLLPHSDEKAAIELQKALRAQGWSYKRIADELSRKGIPTKPGNSKWIHTAVRRILKRPDGYREDDPRTDPRDE